jgi:hypothetical protein
VIYLELVNPLISRTKLDVKLGACQLPGLFWRRGLLLRGSWEPRAHCS